MKKLFLSLSLITALLFTSCSGKTPSSTQGNNSSAQDLGVHTISHAEAKQMMDELEEYILLDVRTPEEFAQQRIDGALLIPDYDLEKSAPDMLEDKNIPIFVYCRSGRRSAASAIKNLYSIKREC